MENRIAFYIDEIFKTIIIFFISLVFYRAMMLSFTLCLILASITTVILAIIFYFVRTKRYAKKKLKISEMKQIENIKEQFSYASQSEINKFFKELFKAEINYKKELVIDNKKTLILPLFDKDILDINDLKKIYRENKNRHIQKIIILCNNYSEDCISLIKNFKIIEYQIFNISDLYIEYLHPQNQFPTFAIEKLPKEKLTLKKIKKYAFNRSKAKTYFFCGLILLFSSYFVPIRIYYLIFASLMFISALLCFILNTKKVNAQWH